MKDQTIAKQAERFIKRLQMSEQDLSEERDKLQDLILEMESLKEVATEAIEDIQAAIESLSRLV